MRVLIKSERSSSGAWMIELWKTPTGYSVYISRGNKHEQRLSLDEASNFFSELVSLL